MVSTRTANKDCYYLERLRGRLGCSSDNDSGHTDSETEKWSWYVVRAVEGTWNKVGRAAPKGENPFEILHKTRC